MSNRTIARAVLFVLFCFFLEGTGILSAEGLPENSYQVTFLGKQQLAAQVLKQSPPQQPAGQPSLSPSTTKDLAQRSEPAQPSESAPSTAQPESSQPSAQPAAPPAEKEPAIQPAVPSGQPAERPAVSPRQRSQHGRRGEVSFNFDDADIYSVIQTIFGDVLRVNYIVDPNVKGRVTFRSVEPVPKENVLPLMEVILRLNGVGIVEEGGLYRIVPISDISKEPAPVGLGRDPEKLEITGKALVQIVRVKYIDSAEMVRVLTPFLSKNALIVDVPKSNYVILVDTDSNVKRLLELVKVFDSEELKAVKPQVFVYSVQNSKAKDVAALLQQIFQGKSASAAPKTTTPPARATTPGLPQPSVQPAPPQPQISMGQQAGEALVSEVTRIIPDEVTNSIIVLATTEDYALIYDTIRKIDIMPRQVMIEGLIVDITLNDNLSYGLSWSMNSDVKISGINPFKNPIDLGGLFTNNPGNLSKTPPNKGFTFIGTDPSGNVRAVLTALEDRSKAKVVAAPHILVSDNREARIQIGQQVPLATSSTAQPISTTGTAVSVVSTSTIQYKDIGIILKVKPQVNDSGLISLELSQEISAISAKAVTVGGLDEVAIDKTEATSNLVARDGETIIIGGLIREDHSYGTTGIPILSRIPIIGALFGTTSDDITRKETIILLTPHVIRNQQEAGTVTSDFIERYKRSTRDKEIDKFIWEQGHKAQDGNGSKDGEEPLKNSP
ncbi:conserved exported hypothetical protein [Candidatus Sulfobium mesophilum]|uniref:Uncharacterized protein n=1 Tax=Candidatus Sulfobium mesophilum TaxID=2016548 RepID=A0A2U3QFM2_9BACT|nr:conserved exported hypothetical protein [Candidatus Sulfobium mesophilum]